MGYKTIDGLMRHLRDNGIDINGSKQKRQLINTGYYHGYKGYRFFKNIVLWKNDVYRDCGKKYCTGKYSS